MKLAFRIVSLLAVTAGLSSGAEAALLSGDIEVFRGATLLGYISKAFDGQNSYTYTSNVANALNVQINTATPTFDILALNGPDAGHPFVGAVAGSGGSNFGPGQLGYAYLSGTGHTNANSPPSSTAGTSIQSLGYNGPAESMIWSLVGNSLSAQWTNTDGSQNPTSFFYDPNVDFVGLVGDLSTFQADFPSEGAFAVSLVFTGSAVTGAVPEPESIALLGLGFAALTLVRRKRTR